MAAAHQDLLPWIQERKCDMQMSMAKAAVEQHNYTVAEMLLEKIDENFTSDMTDEYSVKFSQLASSYYISRAQSCVNKNDRKRACQMLGEANQALLHHGNLEAEICNKRSLETAVNHHILVGRLHSITSQTGDVDSELVTALKKDDKSLDEVCYNSYDRALRLVDEFVMENTKSTCEDLQARCLKQLIEYCDENLMKERENLEEQRKYAVTMTKSVMRAMSLKNPGSSTNVARCLQLCQQFGGDVIKIFREKSTNVSTWLFLPWVGHLVALLDHNQVSQAVEGVIERISGEYPQAVVYPLKCAHSAPTCGEKKEEKAFC